VLRDVMRLVGPCTLELNSDHFSVLARSIISQQISTKAARRDRRATDRSARPGRTEAESDPLP